MSLVFIRLHKGFLRCSICVSLGFTNTFTLTSQLRFSIYMIKVIIKSLPCNPTTMNLMKALPITCNWLLEYSLLLFSYIQVLFIFTLCSISIEYWIGMVVHYMIPLQECCGFGYTTYIFWFCLNMLNMKLAA